MKIAFLNIYNGIVERGAEVFVDEIAAKLTEKNKITVYQAGNKKEKKYRIQQVRGIPYITTQSFAYNFWVLIFSLKILPDLWRGKYDWIIPVNGGWQVLICRLIRLCCGSKILISGHAGVGRDDRINIILGNPNVFVALSPKAQKWANNITYPKKVFYIPNGVNTENFTPSGDIAHLNIKKPLIITISALLPYKRLHLVIQAAKKLKNVSLLFIGNGPERETLQKMGKEILGDRFLLLPYVSHHNIPRYLRAASLFTLPSEESEAFGLVYLEAMACNLPVVAPDDENRRKIIGKAGLFCDVKNINEYSTTLTQALKTEFGIIPRRTAQKFSWDRISEEYNKILRVNK
jgi:glycosyltransferase involved in cell wall biosynthesis